MYSDGGNYLKKNFKHKGLGFLEYLLFLNSYPFNHCTDPSLLNFNLLETIAMMVIIATMFDSELWCHKDRKQYSYY